MSTGIPGYAYGNRSVEHSPLSWDDFQLLKKTVLFTEQDAHALQQSGDILKAQVERVLDVWYGFVGSHPHLLDAFVDRSTGQPDSAYLTAVRRRFGQWILDTAAANYDQAWLDYQHEIGLRHHRSKKNLTDGTKAAAIVPFRYLVGLTYPVVATLRPFLEARGHSASEVEAMQQAWLKSVLLQVILWARPYVRDGDY
jgi:hypothetical protein